MKGKVLAVVSNPFFLSAFMSLVIIFLVPNIFNKYHTKLISRDTRTNKNYLYYYADLNHDGNSEKIELIQHNKDINSIVVYKNGKVIDQWNFEGTRLHEYNNIFGDIDNDGKDEIVTYSLVGDSIYVNCISPMSRKKNIFHKAVTDYSKRFNQTDFASATIGFYDNDNDGVNELYFAIQASYSGYPRRMYAVDLVNNTVQTTPNARMNFLRPFAFISKENKKLVFSSSVHAPGNCSVFDPYTDHFTWLMAFDQQLKFIFEPIKINAHPSTLDVIPVEWNNKEYFLLLNCYLGTNNLKSSILLYDLHGAKVKELELPKNEDWNSSSLLFMNSGKEKQFYIITLAGTIYKIGKSFDEINILKIILPNSSNYFVYSILDIESDGNNEILFKSKNTDEVIIFRNDFSDYVTIDIPGDSYVHHYSLIKETNKKNKLYVEGENYAYIFEYSFNILHYFKYIIYCAIYGAFLGLLMLMQKTQKVRAEQRYKNERKMAELQIRSIKNQIDPHFTLNILNSIGSLYYQQNREKADYIFGKYSKLLRNTILNSDKTLSSLEDEIDYVENYLNLEKYRLSNGFDFNINIDESVSKLLLIPKTLIHTFVENSIKHGIRHLKAEGRIDISINNNIDHYLVLIYDNGIGRKKADEINSSGTGKGLIILNEILDLYYSIDKIKITYSIADPNEGTEVRITVPIKK